MVTRTNVFPCGASEADSCCSVTLRDIGKERLKETFARDASLSLTGARPRKNVRGNERSRAGRWIDSASCLNLIFFLTNMLQLILIRFIRCTHRTPQMFKGYGGITHICWNKIKLSGRTRCCLLSPVHCQRWLVHASFSCAFFPAGAYQ